MKNLSIIGINKIQNTSLKRTPVDYRIEAYSLNKFIKRIERNLNKEVTKKIKGGQKVEDLAFIIAQNIKAYPFKIQYEEIQNQFNRNLESSGIRLSNDKLSDMTLLSTIANFFSKHTYFAEPTCDAIIDLKKHLLLKRK